jgi:hypothetical protein
VKKPALSVDDIIAALKKSSPKEKVSKTTVTAVRANTRHTLATLNQLDMGEFDL